MKNKITKLLTDNGIDRSNPDLFKAITEILAKDSFVTNCSCEHNSNTLVLSSSVICTRCNKEAKHIRF